MRSPLPVAPWCLTPPRPCGHHRTALDPGPHGPWDEVHREYAAPPAVERRSAPGATTVPRCSRRPGLDSGCPSWVCCRFALPILCRVRWTGRDRRARAKVREPSEGRLLAAARKSAVPTPRSWPAPGLVRQDPRAAWRSRTSSRSRPSRFDWLLGNQKWRDRVAEALESRRHVPETSGLEEIFEEISPIEDFSGSMSLSFRDHRFEPPKYTVEQCREKDFTYAAPLFVTAEFMNNETGEIKSQTVFMGDFPLMTDKGTFIINGTERVVVSQLVRSPGVYFERTPTRPPTRTSTSPRSSRARCVARVRDRQEGPRRRPRRPQAQAAGHRAAQGPRPGATSRSASASGSTSPWWPPSRRTASPSRTRRSRTSTASCARASRRRVRPAQALLDNFYFNPKRYDLAKVGRYKINKKLGIDLPLDRVDAHDRGHRRHDRVPRPPARRARPTDHRARGRRRVRAETDDIDHFGNRRLRTVGELIQNQIRTGLSRMERVVRERMTTQDVEAITPQTLINIRPVVASIKEFFGTSPALAVHGPDQPARGPDPQAPPLGARARRSVP